MPVAIGGAGGACAPPLFGRSVNPISTRGVHYPHPVIKIFRPCDGSEKPLFEQQFMYVFMPNSINLGNMTNLKIYQILFQYLFTSWNFAMDYPVVHYYTLHCSLFVSFPGLCEKRTFSWCTVNPHQSLFPLCSHFINVPRPSMYQQVKVNKKVAYGNIISKRAESPLSVHHHWLDWML